MLIKPFFLLALMIGATVAPLSASADTSCPLGIGSNKGDAPFLTVTSPESHLNLIFCGDDHRKLADGVYSASEYEVIRTDDFHSILTFGALDVTDIRLASGAITITRTENLPIGENWGWVDVPTHRYHIGFTDDSGVILSCKKAFVTPQLSKQEIADILVEYSQLPETGVPEASLEKMFVKLMVAALAGNKQAQLDFYQIHGHSDVDGAIAEFYAIVLQIYISASNKPDGDCGAVMDHST